MPSLSEYLHSFAAVVVTGGSSGIGKSFISHIRKLDPEILICNLSRRCPDNADELKVRHFPCDLAQSDVLARIMPELEAALLANAQSARILLLNTKSMLALPGRTYDLRGPGWQQEHWSMSGTRGFGTHRSWLPWVSVNHLHGITGLEELDPALYQRLVKGE